MADREVTLLATLRDGVSGPLSKIGAAFGGLSANLNQIGQRLAPLTGRVGAFVTGLFSVRAANTAINAAKEAVDSEQKLLSALQGRRDLLVQIEAITDRLQNTTTFDNDKLNGIAALLINAGVAVRDLNSFLTLTTDISAGTGKSLETVARALALLNSGHNAGAIARTVPEILDLLKETEGGSKAIELLRVRFKDAAATIASTDFGKAAQQANKLTDQEERLGSQLIKVKVAILSGAVPALARLADALETPEGQAFLNLLTQIVSKVTEFAPQIISVILAAQGFSFLKWLTPFLAFALKLVPVAGAIFLIVQLLEAASVNLTDIGNIIGQVIDFIGQLVKGFFNGAKTAEDFFDVINTRAKQAGQSFYALFINPIIQFFKALVDFAIGAGKTIGGGFTVLAGTVARAFGNAFEFVIKGIAKALDTITNTAADLIEKLPGVGKEVADKLRTNLEASVPKFDFGASALAAGNDLLREGSQLIENAVPDALNNITKGLDDATNEIAKLQNDLDSRMAAREKQRIENSKTTSAAQAKIEIEARKQSLLTIASLEDSINKQLSEKTIELHDRVAKREADILQQQLNDEKITFEAYIAQRTKLELDPILELIAARKVMIDKLSDEKAKLVANKGEVVDILGLTRQILDLTEKQALSIEDQKDKETELNLLRAQNLVKRREQAASEIGDFLDAATRARAQFDAKIETIRGKVKEGFLFSSEGADQEQKALEDLTRQLDTFGEGIDSLLEKNPELQKQFGDVGFQLDLLAIQTKHAEQTFTDFERGFEAGAVNYIKTAADMREAGLKLGETTVSSIGQGFVDAIFEADFSFQEFAYNFLKSIAKMIVQLLLFRALASVLGIGVGGANTGGLILGFNDGGRVPGALVGHDVVNAQLTPGEYVHNTSAVDYYGIDAMQALNRKLIPRDALSGFGSTRAFAAKSHFADGGPVLPTGGSGLSTLVADAQTMDRLLAGGSTSMIRWLRQNADSVRSSIGGSK